MTGAVISSAPAAVGHPLWVRICHWLVAASVFALGFTGFLILMVHPRLYWGEVGNDLTPALLELPISDNHRPAGWQQTVAFTALEHAPISANRTYAIFNENGWGRSLHFLVAWILVLTGAVYVVAGLVSGHVRRNLWPRARDLRLRALWQDLTDHVRLRLARGDGAGYGSLQRSVYALVLFVVLPLMVMTGLTMSPAVTAGYPVLLDLFGGYQSARTVHFLGFAALALFVVVHVAMVALTGLRRQLRAMILGS